MPRSISSIEIVNAGRTRKLVVPQPSIITCSSSRSLVTMVSRISPEAPVPVVLISNEEQRLGGAANVAWNCKDLGARTEPEVDRLTELARGTNGDYGEELAAAESQLG